MRVLLTGASGQIGWELRHFLSPIAKVIAFDRNSCDLTRPKEVARIIREVEPDIIVNAAAYTDVDRAEDEEELATLVNGTSVGVIAEEARRLNALVIHYSTDYVFDGSKETPYAEDDPANPVNAYGRSKLAGDCAIRQAAPDYLILRTSWVFADRGRNFVQTMLRLAQQGTELSVVADQIGTPTWARHIADATSFIFERACQERTEAEFASGIINVTASGATSWWGFAKGVLDEATECGLLRKKPKVRAIATCEYPTPAARPKNSRLSSERLRKRYGIVLPEWQKGLALCIRTGFKHGVTNSLETNKQL